MLGKLNVQADEMSRKFNNDLEWALCPIIFDKIKHQFPDMTIDLFASRLNHKLPKYVSRLPDPGAISVDEFSMTWTGEMYYMFAPFSLMARVLQKVIQDKAEAVVVAPIWATQSWWSTLLHLICSQPCILPILQKILSLPHKPDLRHPLTKMRLAVFRISGMPSKPEEYRRTLHLSLWIPGDSRQNDNTTVISGDGLHSVGQYIIPFSRL